MATIHWALSSKQIGPWFCETRDSNRFYEVRDCFILRRKKRNSSPLPRGSTVNSAQLSTIQSAPASRSSASSAAVRNATTCAPAASPPAGALRLQRPRFRGAPLRGSPLRDWHWAAAPGSSRCWASRVPPALLCPRQIHACVPTTPTPGPPPESSPPARRPDQRAHRGNESYPSLQCNRE